MTCPFCDPQIQKAVFAKSDHFLAIYNIAPILPGHSLIIPKKHVHSVMEMDESWFTEMMSFTREVTGIVLTAFHAEAFNWSLQEKETAGQSIAHLHLHIVPRYPDDFPAPGDWYPKIQHNYNAILDSNYRRQLSDTEMYDIVNKLRLIAAKRKLFSNL